MKNSTILVVDDELFFRRLYAEILSGEGYQVETISSGDEALERISQGGIDVVLTDMVMPGLGGLELLRQTRRVENPPEVILVTGHGTMESAIQALKSGARDYLIKPFNPEELRHLVRTCLEQRRLLDENSLLKSQIQLYQRGQNLASQLDIHQLLPQAVDTLLQEFGQGRGFSMLLPSKGHVPHLLGLKGISEPEGRAFAKGLIPHLKGLTGIRLLRGEEIAPKEGFPQDLRAVCLFPLRCQKRFKGALVFFNAPGRDLPLSHLNDSLLFLTEQAALGFENAYRYHGARELIYTDDLTGLYNHRYLQISLDQELRRSERYGLEFSLVFIDLDHFKEINDTHGHLAGSHALKEVAGLLSKSVRDVDVLFRYGGDEFTALLVETDAQGAALVSERIRRAIEEHTFLAEAGVSARLTATVGYATYPGNATDKKALIDLADQAMYIGKKDRNVARGAWEIKNG